MKIYQVSFDGDGDGHKGYEYTRTLKEAKAKKREWELQGGTAGTISNHNGIITPVSVDCTMTGVLRVLNQFGGHPDNG